MTARDDDRVELREPRHHTSPVMAKLLTSGRAQRATRPGYRPRMHAGDGSDRLGDALRDLRERDEDRR
ncbi:hypothetical protein [Amycolatopsis viridis]|uniref:Uncharacterized protein n=1 Tax=Amycolatopsis viridis TaxID=185678 RepID=A0ABX0SRQ5_9PSEU|nr:hypothetical protein [Amycolatopsis viridis]NIH79646.1 hypothetical protein [Amycolatopsis viridis]